MINCYINELYYYIKLTKTYFRASFNPQNLNMILPDKV